MANQLSLFVNQHLKGFVFDFELSNIKTSKEVVLVVIEVGLWR